ncbi:unnamed protein product [Fusarium fujikuroi]|uniref:Uncharacterized protein n=1 Tax=Fusarium fujikuroi TaxID=5127 RepID=A0A9Q9U7C4_FUSFU|nr:unnamed protein product [Fusarium fujikuroi]
MPAAGLPLSSYITLLPSPHPKDYDNTALDPSINTFPDLTAPATTDLMPAVRNSLQPYDHDYCITGHDLDIAIRPALEAAKSKELKEIYIIVAAIRKNFSLRCRSNLIKIAIFNYSLIQLISCMSYSHCLGSIYLN